MKRETLSSAFAKVALKGSEIAWNVVKVSVYACLLKWVPTSTFKFNSEKVDKNASFEPWFDHLSMMVKIAPNLIKIGVHANILKMQRFRPWLDEF